MPTTTGANGNSRPAKKTALWPLPGGAEWYAKTVRTMLLHVNTERDAGRAVDLKALARWLATEHDLRGKSSVGTYAWLTVQLGLAEKTASGFLVLTTEGNDFAQTGAGTILGRLLCERIAGVCDVFSLLYPGKGLSVGDLHARWRTAFGWQRDWQTRYRLNWLRSAGMVSRQPGGLHILTGEGRALAEELGLTMGALPTAAVPQPQATTASPEGRRMANDNVAEAFELLLEALSEALVTINSDGSSAFKAGNTQAVRQLTSKAEEAGRFLAEERERMVQWQSIMGRSRRRVATDAAPKVRTRRRAGRHKKRLKRGLRTPQSTYRVPILQALVERGGEARGRDVLDRVGEMMENALRSVDLEPIGRGGGMPRWRNAAMFERSLMVTDGLLRADSPRGTWAITERGKESVREQTSPTREIDSAVDQAKILRVDDRASSQPEGDDDRDPEDVMYDYLQSES